MRIPIIYIYLGPLPPYLRLSVAQARTFNDSIIILTDHPEPVAGADVVDSGAYMEGVTAFLAAYRHMSTNSERFETISMFRWLILRNFMTANAIDVAYFNDADVFNFTNISDLYEIYRGYAAAYLHTDGGGAASAACSFWTTGAITQFCEHMVRHYTTERVSQLEAFWAEHQAQQRPGGVCDMTLLDAFLREANIGSLSTPHAGWIFDPNPYLSTCDGGDAFRMEKLPYYRRQLKSVARGGDGGVVLTTTGNTRYRLAAAPEYAKLHDRVRRKPLLRLRHAVARMTGRIAI